MQVWAPLEGCGIQQCSASTHRSPSATSGGRAGGHHIKPLYHTVPLQASDLEHLDSTAGSTNSSLLWQGKPVLAKVRACEALGFTSRESRSHRTSWRMAPVPADQGLVAQGGKTKQKVSPSTCPAYSWVNAGGLQEGCKSWSVHPGTPDAVPTFHQVREGGRSECKHLELGSGSGKH